MTKKAALRRQVERFIPTISAKEVESIFNTGYDAGRASAFDWISVSERLPDSQTEHYLVAVQSDFDEPGASKGFDLALYSTRFGWSLDSQDYSGNPEVIAWMPLPEPYKPEEKQDGK